MSSAGALVVFILFGGMVAALVVGTMAYVKSYSAASKTLPSNTLSSGGVPTVESSSTEIGSPAASLTSNSNAGVVSSTVGTTPTLAVNVTVTFAVPYSSTPRGVVITPMVSNTVVSNFRLASGPTVTGFVVRMDTVSTSLITSLFSYVVL